MILRQLVLLTLLCVCCQRLVAQDILENLASLIQQSAQNLPRLIRDAMTQHAEEPPDRNQLLKEYDFIIVGAGTAGCVLANRLSEVPEWKVLLVEAGGRENFIMDIPIVANILQLTEANWKFKTVPSNNSCLGLKNRQCNYPRGKVMGGSSVLNYMIYTRGHPRDYDHWEELGNKGWGYKNALRYFMKSEDMAEDDLSQDTTHHAKGGYLTVSYIPYRTPLARAFLEAGRQTGQRVLDYNTETMAGFNYLQTTMKNGTRWSASRAFLHPIRSRKNLHVTKLSTVTKILIDPATRTAYGVQLRKGSGAQAKERIVLARKEVIVSAGAINSPQILMLSGIGPKQHLQDMGIPVIMDLPVGYNLQDHVSMGGLVFLVNQTVSLRPDRVLDKPSMLGNYLSQHNGPWSVPGGCEAVAFYDLDHPGDPHGHPNMELLFIGGSIVSHPTLKETFGISDEVYRKVYQKISNSDSWMVLPMLLRPKSRGRIMLASKNPMKKPLIYANYFEHPDDIPILVAGAKITMELSKTKAMQRFGSTPHDVPLPQCAHLRYGTDQYWECLARQLSFTIYHHSGSCKMGPDSDPESVVDPRLRVKGIKKLRVIDASIIPVIPAAHTNAPVYMIAEKGADMIKEDWLLNNT